jgi:hypothetical protein
MDALTLKAEADTKVGTFFPSKPIEKPTEMTNRQLVQFIDSGSVKIAVLCEAFRPYYLELRERFARKPNDKTIEGYRTWNEYCEKSLDRTKRAVNYFLAGGHADAEAKRRRDASEPASLQQLDERAKTLDARLRKAKSYTLTKRLTAQLRELSRQRDALRAVTDPPAATVHVAYVEKVETASPAAIVAIEPPATNIQLVHKPDLALVGEPAVPPINEVQSISAARRTRQCLDWIHEILKYLDDFGKQELYVGLISTLVKELAQFEEQQAKQKAAERADAKAIRRSKTRQPETRVQA